MKKFLSIFLVLALGLFLTGIASAEEEVPLSQFLKQQLSEVRGYEVTEAVFFQFLDFIGNSQGDNMFSLIALTNTNGVSRIELDAFWIPAGAYRANIERIILNPYEIKIIDTQPAGRCGPANCFAYLAKVGAAEYFGASVVTLCTKPTFMGISIQSGQWFVY